MKRILAIVLMLTALMIGVKAETKRALVIGLGEQVDSSWGKINGDNDVPIVCDMLTAAGYSSITTLVNSEATKSGIVSAFNSLISKCRKGDKVYIHFSGHGQQITDLNGDEAARRTSSYRDSLDEAWIPYDAFRRYSPTYHGEKHLTDDEIGAMLTRIRNKVGSSGDILVVVDACHSGDGTRGEPEEGDAPVRGAWDNFVIHDGEKTDDGKRIAEDWITISACKSYQTNEEMKGMAVGKLTYALSKIFVEQPGLSNGKLEDALRTFIMKNPGKRPQTPVLTGATSRYNVSDMF